MQRLVDTVLAITKESVKAFSFEVVHIIVRLINGLSALVLALLPGKANVLEGIHGWELRPTFQGPRLPRWMEKGVSSFNEFVHELSVDSDASSVEYSSGEEDWDSSCPPSPSSQTSRGGGSWAGWPALIYYWILTPSKLILGVPFRFIRKLRGKRPIEVAPSNNFQQTRAQSFKRARFAKDHVIHRATDKRRGVIEDVHLAMEIFIEAVFDFFHKAAHIALSPTNLFYIIWNKLSSHDSGCDDASETPVAASVQTATLGDSNPALAENRCSLNQFLNTDARTCKDVITELGYPYEAFKVVTSDGYVLLLERIPRRDSKKAVYLQHGVLDSSMGWVSNGVVGSPAFAAYDQGYDVFLGNFRGLVSRDHVDKNIPYRKYWEYSINEHGMEDIPAMIEQIHKAKTSELKGEDIDDQPYKLCAVCHSLGGAAILMYVITRRIEEKPHRLSRLILLSPAGFHHDSNIVFTAAEYLFFLLSPILAKLVPAFYIPTRFFRMLLNKLARDFHHYPAVGGLVQTLMSYVVGGDSSNWIGVLGLPHYNMNDMPGVSFYVVQHLAQMKHSGRFRMYDFGNAGQNMEAYGSCEPFDLGENYCLIDIPVDLVAGEKDNVIRPSMVRKHYELMSNGGVAVSYCEFEYAHLDFTFSHREELLSYVMSRLNLVGKNSKPPSLHKVPKVKRK